MSALRPFIPQFQTLFCVAANDEIGQFQQSAMAETQVSVEDMDSGPSISEVDSATRNSLSFAALRACFSRTARAMVGDRESEIEKWAGESLAYDCAQWFLPGLIACSIHALSGAPEEWCFRKDENTVSWCSGDPPNPNCKTISCPLTSCNTSSVFSRCGMVFNPKLK